MSTHKRWGLHRVLRDVGEASPPLLLVVMVVLMTSAAAQQNAYFSNIPGDWCKTRADPCCLMRQDDCSLPILGTRCYCDEFCNRDYNPDCCPDYLPVCLGVTPATTSPPDVLMLGECHHDGAALQAGHKFKDNCNSCECLESGVVLCTGHKCLTEPHLLQQLGADQEYTNKWGWRATNYSMFWGRTLKDGLTFRTGTIDPVNRLYPIYLDYDPLSIPDEFDARKKWPYQISRPRDQGWCGSSWAFSTVTVATDRLAIETNGTEAVPLSPQNLISCDRKMQQGCEGGTVEWAWQYLRRHGVVDEMCYPYTSHEAGAKGTCKIPRKANFQTLHCDSRQQESVGRVALYHTEPAYRIRSDERDIQYEIMTNGPVQALMRVRQDFFYYHDGVYSSSGLSDPYQVGEHSVRLIGWGEQRGGYGAGFNKYWLAVNSWGEEWGEEGLFRIQRGVNESGIEETILTVRAGLLIHYPALIQAADTTWFFGSTR